MGGSTVRFAGADRVGRGLGCAGLRAGGCVSWAYGVSQDERGALAGPAVVADGKVGRFSTDHAAAMGGTLMMVVKLPNRKPVVLVTE